RRRLAETGRDRRIRPEHRRKIHRGLHGFHHAVSRRQARAAGAKRHYRAEGAAGGGEFQNRSVLREQQSPGHGAATRRRTRLLQRSFAARPQLSLRRPCQTAPRGVEPPVKTRPPVKMRLLKFFLLCATTALLAGCAGYHLGPVNGGRAGEKSIEVLPFNSKTLQPRLGEAVTQALRERLQTDGTYRLATRGGGDIVVTGVIISHVRDSLSFLPGDVLTAENYHVTITAH